MIAAEYLMHAVKCKCKENEFFNRNNIFLCLDGAMNDSMKQNIRAKVNSYIKRAEEIKNISKDGPGKKKAVADGGNSKDNKDDDDSGDPDRKRMMQKFEGIFSSFSPKFLFIVYFRSYCY
jgi:hypothetical protein